MRTRLVRSAVVLALTVSGAAAFEAQAAAPTKVTFSYTDPKGDANALNDQGEGTPLPKSTVTPAGSMDSKDILAITYVNTGTLAKKPRRGTPAFTCTGFTATLTLAAAPDATGTIYRMTSNSANGIWWLEFENGKADVRIPDSTSTLGFKQVPLLNPPVITGAKATLTVTLADLKATGENPFRFVLSGFGAEVRSVQGASGLPYSVVVPLWDQAAADAGTSFKPC